MFAILTVPLRLVVDIPIVSNRMVRQNDRGSVQFCASEGKTLNVVSRALVSERS
jgi:hypothetical protein